MTGQSGPKAYLTVGDLPPDQLLPVAGLAEVVGFDGVGVTEHVLNLSGSGIPAPPTAFRRGISGRHHGSSPSSR